MTHSHSHDHHHNEISSNLSLDEKLIKLLEHWVVHNNDHAKTYSDWSQKAKEKDYVKAGDLIKEAAEMTLAINSKFEQAADLLKN